MIHRFFTAAALIVCASASIWAAERATLVMTDGERKSGTVVFHGSQGNNVIDDQFNLGFDGREESYPASRVAVIDFVGGQPSISEQQVVSKEQANVLALRNGQVELGRFVNIVNGVTVVWQNSAGAQVNLPISDVSRIYLNLGSARNVYGIAAAPTNATASLPPGSIRVDGKVPWIDTGMTVKKGDRLVFSGTGEVTLQPGTTTGVAGTNALNGKYPVKTVGAGGLIGRVEASGLGGRIGSGALFPIGGNAQPIAMPANGRLFLGINDDNFADNDGLFAITIERK